MTRAGGVVTQGDQRLTVFAPQDRAFINLVKGLGVEVNPSKPLSDNRVDSLHQARSSRSCSTTWWPARPSPQAGGQVQRHEAEDGAGGKLTIKVKKGKIGGRPGQDFPTDAESSKPDINKGNKQIAHGINAVLVPKAGLSAIAPTTLLP